jgi:hypothetical protein
LCFTLVLFIGIKIIRSNSTSDYLKDVEDTKCASRYTGQTYTALKSFWEHSVKSKAVPLLEGVEEL